MQDIIKKYQLQNRIEIKENDLIEIWSQERERTNINKISLFWNKSAQINDYSTLAILNGANTKHNFNKYKGEIGIDYNTNKLIFSGNNMLFHDYYKNILYNRIIVKDENNNIIKNIEIMGHESMQDIIQTYNLQDGIPYQDDYSLEIWSIESDQISYIDSNLISQKIILNNLTPNKNSLKKLLNFMV